MKALIIDDEESNRWLISSMLEKHCPHVKILGNAGSVDEAFRKINELKPDLVFLDIKMPEKNGFDLLRMLAGARLTIIFITGFDEYAIQAFEFNAIDYVLKPIDYVKLMTAVKKAEEKIITSTFNNVIHFINNIEEKTNLINKIMFHTNDKVHVVDLDEIIFVMANRGYSEIYTIGNRKYMSAKPLADYEVLLTPLPHFIRINKSYIVNIKHISSYTKGPDCLISMKEVGNEIEVSRRRKNEIIALFKGR